MARQGMHNRRAGRGAGGGASWISYSDMMAALLLLFVLILCVSLYQYFDMLEKKTLELDLKTNEMEEQRIILIGKQEELDEKNAELTIAQVELETAQAELEENKAILIIMQGDLEARQVELDAANASLILKQAELDAATNQLELQRQELATQTQKIDDLVGVRSKIIRTLSTAFIDSNLKAAVDPNTGDIILESTVFFETNSHNIKAEGKAFLDAFIPIYLDVLLSPEYADYLGEIIIEGHTDSSGTYERNLQLSQERALEVALYCLNMEGLTNEQKTVLQKILTAKGRSESDLRYDANGVEDPVASRRVEFKFSLKDAEMIQQMNALLQSDHE